MQLWIQEGGEARPEDLLLEQQLDNPILQVASFPNPNHDHLNTIIVIIMIIVMSIIMIIKIIPTIIIMIMIIIMVDRLEQGSLWRRSRVCSLQFSTQESSLFTRCSFNSQKPWRTVQKPCKTTKTNENGKDQFGFNAQKTSFLIGGLS